MSREQLIPRIIHRVWLGPDPVPSVFEYYAESWRRHHPSWDVRLWRDETLPPLSCQAELETVTGFKKRYDIVRLEILRQAGGVIVDMDVEAVRQLDPLLAGVAAFVGRLGGSHIGNQVLGAVPRHPFFELAISRIRASLGVDGSSSEVAGKAFLKQLLAEHPDGVAVFPEETFYFEPSFDPPRQPDAFPQVYAVHHELASYASLLPAGTVEQRLSRLVGEVANIRSDIDRAQLNRAERRLRDAIATNEEAYRAKLRCVEAEREQAEARLREAERTIEALRQRLPR